MMSEPPFDVFRAWLEQRVRRYSDAREHEPHSAPRNIRMSEARTILEQYDRLRDALPHTNSINRNDESEAS